MQIQASCWRISISTFSILVVLTFIFNIFLEYSLVDVMFPGSSTLLSLMDRSVPLFLIFSNLDAWSRRFWLFNCKFFYPISSHNSFIASIYPIFLPFSLQGGFSEEISSCAFFLRSKISLFICSVYFTFSFLA